MSQHEQIPVFNLFGETLPFPDVIHCERIHDRAFQHDWTIPSHRHANMSQIFHMENGSATVRLDAREERLENGHFLFVPVQTVHGFVFSQGTEGRVLSFPQPVIESLAPRTNATEITLIRPFQAPATPELVQMFATLETAYKTKSPLRTQKLVALSHAIFAAITETQVQDSAPEAAGYQAHLQALGPMILEKCVAGWRPGDYARELGITVGHLNRICQQAYGQSATDHIEATVMTEATRLLAFTRLGIAEIGYRLGYDDPTYFSRRFRKARDQSPSDYRRAFFTSAT